MMVIMNVSKARALFYKGLVAIGLGATLLLASACIRPEPIGQAAATVSAVHGAGNELLVELTESRLTVDVHSSSGIGQATITLMAGQPVSGTLQLHLAGLEQLQVSSGALTLVAQVSSQADHAISQSVATAPTPVSAAQAIDAAHPLWLSITPASAAQPYFVVTLPAAFLATVDSTVTIEWIDFYR